MQFSIVVPVYRVQPYLKQCVNSILVQSFHDYELILIDDGSSDDCPRICDNFAAVDSRVRVIHQENHGLSAARNVGIHAARGDYILLVDSDDFWPEKDMLEHLSVLLCTKKADVLLFRVKAWEEAKNKSRVKNAPYRFNILDRFDLHETLHYILSAKQFPVGVYAMCVRRQLLQDNQIDFIEGVKSEDYDWILNVLKCCSRIYATDRILYIYRMGRPDSITHQIDLNHVNDILESASKWSKAPGFADPFVRRDVCNYAAYIYTTALVVTGSFPKPQRQQAIKLLRQHRKAIRGARWMYLRLIRLSMAVFGISITTIVLHLLYELKLRIELK